MSETQLEMRSAPEKGMTLQAERSTLVGGGNSLGFCISSITLLLYTMEGS